MQVVFYTIVGIMDIYMLIFLTRELAILLTLKFRGKSMSATLKSAFGFSKFSRWQRYVVYQYHISGHDYQRIRGRWLFLFEPASEVPIVYLPSYPLVARVRVSNPMFICQLLFYGLLHSLFVFVLMLYPVVSLSNIYLLFFLFLVALIVRPNIATHPVLSYLCEPRIPKHAIEEKM